MARANRGRVHGGIYHVWRRAVGPSEMFYDDFDRTSFCKRLERSLKKYDWSCIAFVLMRTHFHLVVRVEDDVMPAAMRDFFGPYVQEFNRRWDRSGHLRSGPYRLRFIEDDRALITVAQYVARNPVRAGACLTADEWTWGSYRGSAGYSPNFPFVDDELLLGCLHDDRAQASRILRWIVEEPPRGAKPLSG